MTNSLPMGFSSCNLKGCHKLITPVKQYVVYFSLADYLKSNYHGRKKKAWRFINIVLPHTQAAEAKSNSEVYRIDLKPKGFQAYDVMIMQTGHPKICSCRKIIAVQPELGCIYLYQLISIILSPNTTILRGTRGKLGPLHLLGETVF